MKLLSNFQTNKHVFASIVVVLVLLFLVFFFVVPLRDNEGVESDGLAENPGFNSLCIGYPLNEHNRHDGEVTKKFHVMLNGLRTFNYYSEGLVPISSGSCGTYARYQLYL